MIRRIADGLKINNNLPDYLLLLVALLAGWGAIVYYLYALNWTGIIISLILAGGSFALLHRSLLVKNRRAELATTQKNNWSGPLIYAVIFIILLALLGHDRSAQALVSPWQVVSAHFFWVYALASLLLVFIIVQQKIKTGIKIILISGHYLISLSVAVIIYKIGYGFDPFIHQATMELIAAKGLVLPKPPYYLGEYSLLVIISKISGLSLYWLNKILVPGLTAVLLPWSVYQFFMANQGSTGQPPVQDEADSQTTILLTSLFILGLTFAPFILTTPQNLSYLFLILTVLAAGRYQMPGVIILALTTTAIHPLTGLPALALIAWLIYKKYQTSLSLTRQKIIKTSIWLFTALSLPLALLLSGLNNVKTIGGGWSHLFQPLIALIANPNSAGQENWILNFVYFWGYNYNLLIIILIIAVLTAYCRRSPQRTQRDSDLSAGLIFLSSALLLAYWLSHQIVFNDLISYEQTDYANRITIIILIFLLPLILGGMHDLIARLRQQNRLIQTIWLIFGVGLLTTSLYLSYPRLDRYWNSRGYSTSADDLAAVQLVNKNSTVPYIVLADQQVSAAALQTFGFNHYYSTAGGPLYFYPIPTGGPLYQYYLRLVYGQPDRATLLSALNLAGVNRAYLIINKYWYQSDRLINAAKLTAEKWWSVNDQDYIFQYSR
jgi:hypothetical protein